MNLLSATILLFLIMDPMGNVPLFLSVLKHVPPERRMPIVIRELCLALGVLLLMLFFGRYLLIALDLRQESISMAGGIVLFLIGIKMIFPPRDGIFGSSISGEPFIVPLAIPSVAGPSMLAALLLLVNREPDRMGTWLIALLIAWGTSAAILCASTWLYRFLGENILTALERLMGMILVAISVQMFMDGVRTSIAPPVEHSASSSIRMDADRP